MELVANPRELESQLEGSSDRWFHTSEEFEDFLPMSLGNYSIIIM